MHGATAWGLVALLLLGGCASKTTNEATMSASVNAPVLLSIHGVVVDTALRPLDASVTLIETNQTQVARSGVFRFDDLSQGVHTLKVAAPTFRSQTLTISPEAGREEVRIVMEQLPGFIPYNQTLRFKGHMDCGFEVLIIPGPCDVLLQQLGPNDPHLLKSNTTFLFNTDPHWRSIVLDFAFNAPSPPTYSGYHTTLRAPGDANKLDQYKQYGQFQGTKSFSVGLEPGQTYPGGTDGPLPANATRFKLEIYPMGVGWHAGCPNACLLGVGVGAQMDIQVIATVFYVTPAPAGFTTLPK